MKLDETGNFIVLTTVCIVYGAYFLGLIWARGADKQDEMKVRTNDMPLWTIDHTQCTRK